MRVRVARGTDVDNGNGATILLHIHPDPAASTPESAAGVRTMARMRVRVCVVTHVRVLCV